VSWIKLSWRDCLTKKTGGENKELHQLRDVLMYCQILKSNRKRKTWRSVERIYILNSTLKEFSWTLLYCFADFFCRNQAPCTLRRRNLKTEALLWQRIKCFPSTLRRRNLNTGHFGFASEENSVKEIPWLSWRDRFRKASFSKSFPSTRQQNDGVFKFLWFENCFRKPPFLWRISVDGRPNRRNKAAFSNFSGLKSVFVPD